MTRPQLTTILIYLKSAAVFIESAQSIAEKAKDEEIERRLLALSRSTSIEITQIDDLRSLTGDTSSN